jgi:hypothetical protein
MRRAITWIVAVAGMGAGAGAVQRPAIPQPPVVNRVEFDVFVQKYGPNRNSQDEEEWFIRDYFKDRRGGTFVDVGAASTSGSICRTCISHRLDEVQRTAK